MAKLQFLLLLCIAVFLSAHAKPNPDETKPDEPTSEVSDPMPNSDPQDPNYEDEYYGCEYYYGEYDYYDYDYYPSMPDDAASSQG